MKTARIYMRVSTKPQDASIPQQRKACRELAKKKGWKVLGEYQDKESAYKKGYKERQQFNQMITDCETEPTDYIVVFSLNRFTRRWEDGLNLMGRLNSTHTQVYACDTDKIYHTDDFSGLIQFAIEVNESHAFSEKLSGRMTLSMETRRDNDRPLGRPNFGYTQSGVTDGSEPEWIPDPEGSDIVVRMFQMFDSGYSYAEISRELNALNILIFGKEPMRGTIRKMLMNPIYGGFQKDKHSGEPRRVNIQTFVPPNLWKRVYSRTSKVNSFKRTANNLNPLTGLVTCGVCGSPAHVIGNKPYDRYRCRKHRDGACDADTTVGRKKLEVALWELYDEILGEHGIDGLIDAAIEVDLSERKEEQKSVQPLLDKLRKLDDDEDKLTDLVLKAGNTPKLTKRLQAIQRERDEVQEQIEGVDADFIPLSRDELLDAYRELSDEVQDAGDLVPFIHSLDIVEKNVVEVTWFGDTYRLPV